MKSTLVDYSPTLLIELNEEVLSKTSHSNVDILNFLIGLGYHKQAIGHSGEGKNFAFTKSGDHQLRNS